MKKNKSLRRLAAFIIIFAMVLSMGFDAIKVFATDVSYDDTIEIFKTAEKGTGSEDDCRTFDVELKITGTPPAKPVDVVIVIDRSSSMGSSGRIGAAKAAAISFANKVLGSGNPNDNRISLVTYDVTSDMELDWNSDYTQVETAINNISLGNGTNIQAGFIKAETQISSARTGVNKAIVLLSDGRANKRVTDPTRSYAPPHDKDTAAAYQKGEDLQAKAKIFTIGLAMGTNTTAKETLEWSANSGNYYDSPNGASDDLGIVFSKDSIVVEIKYGD